MILYFEFRVSNDWISCQKSRFQIFGPFSNTVAIVIKIFFQLSWIENVCPKTIWNWDIFWRFSNTVANRRCILISLIWTKKSIIRQNSNVTFWWFSNTVAIDDKKTFLSFSGSGPEEKTLKGWRISRGKIRIFISNPINPKMIWHSEIQDWILFKVQVQQDFSTFWDEMNYTMIFKLILNINNEIMTNFNLDIGIFQIIIFYFIFLSLQK